MFNLTETKWKIIKELLKGNKTPTKISKKLGMSLPAIHRELTDLEREGIIKKEGKIKGKTRPFFEYSLKEFIHFIKAFDGEAEEKFLPIDENFKLHFRIWTISQQEFHYYIENFWWSLRNLDDFKNIMAVGIFGSVARGDARKNSDIDVLILTKNGTRLPINEEEAFSALIVSKGKTEAKTVMSKIFEHKDFEISLIKGSRFAKEIIKDIIIIYDPENFLEKLKNEFTRKAS